MWLWKLMLHFVAFTKPNLTFLFKNISDLKPVMPFWVLTPFCTLVCYRVHRQFNKSLHRSFSDHRIERCPLLSRWYAAIDRYLLPGLRQNSCTSLLLSIDRTDGQTDTVPLHTRVYFNNASMSVSNTGRETYWTDRALATMVISALINTRNCGQWVCNIVEMILNVIKSHRK